MSAKVQWSGLDEFLRDLGSLPQALHEDGLSIIRDETEGAAAEIRQAYPRGKTGNLAARVQTSYPSATILVGLVLSRSPHSHLYEFGTRVRRTLRGANRGRMSETPVTVPIARRRRSRMARRLVDMLRAKGFEVGNE